MRAMRTKRDVSVLRTYEFVLPRRIMPFPPLLTHPRRLGPATTRRCTGASQTATVKALATAAVFGVTLCIVQACAEPEEAPRVRRPVWVDPSGVTAVNTDLGYRVELTTARVMVSDLAFTIAGEAHSASILRQVSDLIVPRAYAHPGHFQGGDVTGELRGRFELDWLDGSTTLGTATLLVGSYQSANFTFVRATEADGVAAADPLMGHTALLSGTATKDAATVEFSVIIDSPEGRQLIGAPFDFELKEASTERLGVRLLTEDPQEGDTLFDGVDFAALDVDGDGQVSIDPASTEAPVVAAYNLLRRTFQTHDHFDVRPSAE